MKLIKFARDNDYGQDYYVQALITNRRSFFQGCVSWCEYPGWISFQIKFGMGSLVAISFDVYKLGFYISLFELTWKL